MTDWREIDEAAKSGKPVLLRGSGIYHGVPFIGKWSPSEYKPDEPWVHVITRWRVPGHCVTHYVNGEWIDVPVSEE